jgi:predicted glycoside hydrolase/deacetylase ChbG (UPF0249 family)
MSEKKSIILCADDYGLNPEVSQGIYQLALEKRLSAVSCLVMAKNFKDDAVRLLSLKDRPSIGLHFNLTEPGFLSTSASKAIPLPKLLIKSHCFNINKEWLRKEFIKQMESFVKYFQMLPDFIDGHQHIHTFPIIRDIILDEFQKRYSNKTIAFRSTWPNPGQLKDKIIRFSGGHAFHRLLNKKGLMHNKYFMGVYDFNPQSNYRAYFCAWLEKAKAETLIMCHPALGSSSMDKIAEARVNEYHYLSSADFWQDCDQYQVQLIPFKY